MHAALTLDILPGMCCTEPDMTALEPGGLLEPAAACCPDSLQSCQTQKSTSLVDDMSVRSEDSMSPENQNFHMSQWLQTLVPTRKCDSDRASELFSHAVQSQ